MDAVLHTYLLLLRAKLHRGAIRNLNKLRCYYAITEMDDIYQDTIRFCIANFTTKVIENIPPGQTLENILYAVKFLLTIALAHPDPSSLERLGHDRVHYIPGIRFVRMMLGCIRYMQATEDHTSLFESERACIEKCGFTYPSFVECESWWGAYLNPH